MLLALEFLQREGDKKPIPMQVRCLQHITHGSIYGGHTEFHLPFSLRTTSFDFFASESLVGSVLKLPNCDLKEFLDSGNPFFKKLRGCVESWVFL